MLLKRIRNATGDGFYTFIERPDFQFANPIEKTQEVYISIEVMFMENDLLLQSERNPEVKLLMDDQVMMTQFLKRRANDC